MISRYSVATWSSVPASASKPREISSAKFAVNAPVAVNVRPDCPVLQADASIRLAGNRMKSAGFERAAPIPESLWIARSRTVNRIVIDWPKTCLSVLGR